MSLINGKLLREGLKECLFKRPPLVPVALGDFHPVHKLPFLGKVVEKIVM